MTDPKWLAYAREFEGLREIVGSRHEAKIVKFFAEAGHPEVRDDETAWCAAFANAMLARAGVKGTGSLMARSFLRWGETIPFNQARPGDIVVFPRGDSKTQGHVAFFLREVGDAWIEVIGGNQSNAVTIARYPKRSLLGVRRPSAKAARPKTMAKTREGAGAIATGVGGSIIAINEVAKPLQESADTMSGLVAAAGNPVVLIALAVIVAGVVIWLSRRQRLREHGV